jgi:pyruvate dehydrogenase E2 component (dihydrolipoamide acetyltransferase)
VAAGEVLAEIETDKATMEWESPEDGTLAEVYVQEGGKVSVGDKIAFIRGEAEETPKQEGPADQKQKQGTAEEKEKRPQRETEKPAPARAEQIETAPPQQESPAAPVSAGQADIAAGKPSGKGGKPQEARIRASPVARRIAAELGLDLGSLTGTGPEGRITETDVRAAAKTVPAGADRAVSESASKTSARRKAGESARIQLSGMRKIIAQRLTESLGPVPHFYLTIDVNAGPLMEAREELKSAGEGEDASKITVNDFVLKASVMAAVKVPRVNASFDNDTIVQYQDVDLGIAVAIEDGLLTPVIRAAQEKSLREISAAAKDLAHRARNKRMKPEEFQGGTFTVSNLGGMGIDSFSAVINPPQGFILAIGKLAKIPVVDDCDQLMVGHRMSVTMSCDHRVIDGALGAEYLKELRHLLENPALLMV